MRIVLVTGLIGSGKSALCAELSRRGYPVYDSDSRTKALYECVPGLREKIEETIGVPFSQIAVIFSDDAKRKALEDLVYPLVMEDFRKFALESNAPCVIFESAVALSKPLFQNLFDAVVVVRADYETRVARNPKAAGRSLLQSEPAKADYIIENNGSLQELCEQADRMIETLKI